MIRKKDDDSRDDDCDSIERHLKIEVGIDTWLQNLPGHEGKKRSNCLHHPLLNYQSDHDDYEKSKRRNKKLSR